MGSSVGWWCAGVRNGKEVWNNERGGYCPREGQEAILAEIELPAGERPPVAVTSTHIDVIEDAKGPGCYGLLSPEGEAYYCVFAGHAQLAQRLFNADLRELLAAGWLHFETVVRTFMLLFSRKTAMLEWPGVGSIKADGARFDPDRIFTPAQFERVAKKGIPIQYYSQGDWRQELAFLPSSSRKNTLVAELPPTFPKFSLIQPLSVEKWLKIEPRARRLS